MIRYPIKSNNLKSAGYDNRTQTLEIEFFSSSVYQYYKVPKRTYQGLLAGSDPEKFFYDNIRTSFGYKNVGYEPPPAQPPVKELYSKLLRLFQHNFVENNSQPARIIDISSIQSSKISRPAVIENKNWLQLLEVPYERSSLRIPQIKTEIFKLYEEICGFIDEELAKQNSSLNKLRHQLGKRESYYGNILYTIYCIAEGEIVRYYSGRGHENNFSFDLLITHSSKELAKAVKEFCLRHVRNLPPATLDTQTAYHLTSNGLNMVWWDLDGTMRQSYNLSETQTSLLNRSQSRSTVLLKIPEVKIAVFRQYLDTLEVLRDKLQTIEGWSKKLTKYLNRLFDKPSPYWYNQDDIKLSAYLLKICEQTVRENIPYARLLNSDKEMAHLKRILPKEAFTAVLETATHLKEPINLSEDTISALRSQNPYAWKKDVVELSTCDTARCIQILNLYRNDKDFNIIAKGAIRNTFGNCPNSLLCCFGYCQSLGQKKLEKTVAQKIERLIPHPQQQLVFFDLVAQHKPIDSELAKELVKLTTAPIRYVSLNTEKIQAAHTEHAAVVSRVSSYLGEKLATQGELPSITHPAAKISLNDLFQPDQSVETTINLTDEQYNFLRLLIENDYVLNEDDAEVFSKKIHKSLNNLLQGINKLVYVSIEDQLLVQKSGKITVDVAQHSYIKQITNEHNPA